MSDNDGWLSQYSTQRAELRYPMLYWVSVLLVVLGTVGLLWSLPVPYEFVEISPLLNWGSAFLMATVVYYFIISVTLAIGMLPFVLGIALFQFWLEHSLYEPPRVATSLLVAGIIGLWLGHKNRLSAGAVLTDLQMIMLAPIWGLSRIYRWLGIPI